ncbi:MAG: phosphoadenylyl-sulfate reductase [Candidatus Bathyarchaeia archaeon]
MTHEIIIPIPSGIEKEDAYQVLKWALNKFHPKIAIASSFGAEDVVLIDMASKIIPKPRVFTLDTGRLHQETYSLMDRIRERYAIDIELYFPETSAVEEITRKYGVNLFYKSVELRELCCKVRKVEPLKRALASLDAWITGLRREQAPTRSTVKKVEYDQNGKLKINPVADWTNQQVWDYIKEYNVPYNPLHDQGYPSIGCLPCTRPVKRGEDPRSGRWWWEKGAHKECGLHLKTAK